MRSRILTLQAFPVRCYNSNCSIIKFYHSVKESTEKRIKLSTSIFQCSWPWISTLKMAASSPRPFTSFLDHISHQMRLFQTAKYGSDQELQTFQWKQWLLLSIITWLPWLWTAASEEAANWSCSMLWVEGEAAEKARRWWLWSGCRAMFSCFSFSVV